MKDLIGVINLDDELDQLNELTYFRCGAAVPFAGRYRLIDFVLSNMTNAGIVDIALFVRRKYRSLMDHLGEGKSWDLDRNHGGLFILPPDWNDPTDISLGDLQHVHNNLDFFYRSSGSCMVHSGSRHISKVNLREVYKQHKESGADITLVYKPVAELRPEHEACLRIEADEQGQVTDIHHELNHPNVYMELFIMDKYKYLELVKDCIAHGKSQFFRDAIQENRDRLKIGAYRYTGYHAVINSVESYFANSMELLQREPYEDLFRENPIRTKIKYEVPAKYLEQADVRGSLVANGCMIAGQVENSILFRGVQVGKGARISNSILMQKCIIEENAVIENVIMDKDVHLSRGVTLVGDSRKPFVIAKSSHI
ncbi:glucose-1-phosphate adenylyltransferase [Paenibacillus yonginensis]|uniref:Glucose-1-phosphate adenylyltransferase n=1 Tax=Paenibacillus yonginensis TaxID=1462996 RepID=A0A1B1MY96_9BACL|nr:glucose-1-phosphate adenylyltransferase subunit GlgD [Paenibacillus yonginensis]ANS74154.1 glucose-1-phosphate adenylyltransferase [Paenibacillus yonginensis]